VSTEHCVAASHMTSKRLPSKRLPAIATRKQCQQAQTGLSSK
jgi:hypothetical protein